MIRARASNESAAALYPRSGKYLLLWGPAILPVGTIPGKREYSPWEPPVALLGATLPSMGGRSRDFMPSALCAGWSTASIRGLIQHGSKANRQSIEMLQQTGDHESDADQRQAPATVSMTVFQISCLLPCRSQVSASVNAAEHPEFTGVGSVYWKATGLVLPPTWLVDAAGTGFPGIHGMIVEGHCGNPTS